MDYAKILLIFILVCGSVTINAQEQGIYRHYSIYPTLINQELLVMKVKARVFGQYDQHRVRRTGYTNRLYLWLYSGSFESECWSGSSTDE